MRPRAARGVPSIAALLALLFAFSAASCGGGEEGAVRQAYGDLSAAVAAKDGPAARAAMSPEYIEDLSLGAAESPCAKLSSDFLPAPATGEVRFLQPDFAELSITRPGGWEGEVKIVKHSGKWVVRRIVWKKTPK